MNKSINLNDENIKNGIRILENTFIDINNSLFDENNEPLEIIRPTNSSNRDSVTTYNAFVRASENIINNVNQINYWSNAAISCIFVDAILIAMLKAKDKKTIMEMAERHNLITQINTALDLLVSTFKDLTIFKNYIMAIKHEYKLKQAGNLIGYLEDIQVKVARSFDEINDEAYKVNKLLDAKYLGKVKINDNDYEEEFDKMLEKVKDLEFLSQPYPIIANEFYSKFNLEFQSGIDL